MISGSPRAGNVWNPRNESFNAGGNNYGYQIPKTGGSQAGRGGFQNQNKTQGGSSGNQFHNNGGKNNPNRGQPFHQKQKPQNKGFRGGGN
jgi:hypothetical protein